MKYWRCCLAVAWLSLGGCWANPSLVKIQSDPPGARVFFNEQELGTTPVSTVLACVSETQYVRLQLADEPTQNIPLYKKPIRYFVPWYAVVAAGVFSFKTTWRSEACIPETLTVKMTNETMPKPNATSPAGGEPQPQIEQPPAAVPPVQSGPQADQDK